MKCSVCLHPKRKEIDRDLIAGEPIRNIAEQFHLGSTSVFRHKQNHLSGSMVKAQDAREVTQADNLLDQVKDLQTRALRICEWAELGGDLKTALQGIREVRECIRLLGELAGKLSTSPTVNVLLSAEWITIRALVLQSLGPYPEARNAVVGALTDANR